MAAVRKDRKGRNLRVGERQKSNGYYEYRYTDSKGNRKSICSKDLARLREKERIVIRDMEDGIQTDAGNNMTLNAMFEIYMGTKRNLKKSTKTNYRYMWKNYAEDSIGKRPLSSIKKSDVIKYYNGLLDHGFKANSLEIMHTLLHPTLTMAVDDGYIRLNPAAGVMKLIDKGEATERQALTLQQQEAFVAYTASSTIYSHWLPLFTVLLGTGCRIGEIIGLRWSDVDLKEGIIEVNHNLIYRVQDDGSCEFHITTPKTEKGKRIIPMLDDVKKALLQEKKSQLQKGHSDYSVDGYTNFIFLNRYGKVHNPMTINRAIKRIYTAYNKEEAEKAKKEKREPVLIPHFSVHVMRHTFCTRFCENETNIKVIQEIMGHSDISTTMNIYNHATKDKKKEAMHNLNGKVKIS